MRANFSSASPRSFSRLADCAAPSSSSDSPSSSSICASSSSGDSAFFGSKSSLAFGSIRPSTNSSTRDSSFSTLSASSRISRTVVGQALIAWIMWRRPSSMRLAISISPSRVSSSTEPISRMYMREMGSGELLTREGEIEIAKRIEEGLRHMIQAISACPTTVREILELADKVEKDESRVDEVVDGLIDPNAKDDFDPKKAESPEDEEADRGGRGRIRGRRRRCAVGEPAEAARRGAREVRPHPPPLRQDGE